MAIYVSTFEDENLKIETEFSNLQPGDVPVWDPVKGLFVNQQLPVTTNAIKDLIGSTIVADPTGVSGLRVVADYNPVTHQMVLNVENDNLFGIDVKKAGVDKGQVRSLNFDGSAVASITILNGVATVTLNGGSGGGGTGADGKSAYQLAVDNGFSGTEAQWLQSLVGQQGSVGPQGPSGADGAAGPQGPAGQRGAKGDQGVSVNLLGSVATTADLPISGNAGEGWIVQSNGHVYLWNTITFTWNDVGQIVGPQGNEGPVGPQGPAGPAGAVGPAGPQGIQGIPGQNGSGTGTIGLYDTGDFINNITALDFSGATVSIDGTKGLITIEGAVASVNGQTGVVVLNTDNVTEGVDHLYYTTARFDSRLSTKTTDNLSEGSTNFYFTNSRFDNRLATKTSDNITEGTTNFYFTNAKFDTRFGTKTTSNLTEGSNLYYTTVRANTDFDSRLATKTSDNLTEGSTNLYFTLSRANTAFDNRLATKTTSDVNEGSNLYFTNTRADTRADLRIAAARINDLYDVDTTGVQSGQALVWDGTKWVTGSPTAAGTVSSVNGKSGIVTLTTSDINEGSNLYYTSARANSDFDSRLATKTTTNVAEGSNLYYTDARFDSRLATKSTTNLAEGTNLYYTQARFDTALAAKSTTNVAEGTNLYHTDARSRAAISAGTGISYNSSTGVISSSITQYTDALAGAAAKAAISVSGSLSYNSSTGVISYTTPTTSGITEGTNLYYTDARADARIAAANLKDLADVSNTAPNTNQVLKWNGTAWAPANDLAGAGVMSATVQVDYDASGNLSGLTVLSGTLSATITNAASAAAEVTFTFTGSTLPPLSTTVYGYQRVANIYVQRAVDSSFSKRQLAGGGASGSPTAFTAFDASTHTMVISLTRSLTGASAGVGQTTSCIVQFVLV